jgi:carboxylesterase type B
LWSFLQTADAKAIDAASNSYTSWAQSDLNGVRNGQLQQGFFYAPVVEAANANAFLTNRPYEALATGDFNQVPILIGTCADEGLMSYNQWLQWTLSVFDQNPDFLVPQGMKIGNQDTKVLVGNAIKKEYSPNGDMQYNLLSGINFFTDQNFQKSLIRHAELQSHFTDVYFYVFSYSGQMGGNTENRYPGTSNVTHTEEGSYLLQRSNPANFPQADQNVHQRLVKLWLNFIIYQNPTPSQDETLQNVVWPKLQDGNLQYLDIGANLQSKTNPKDKYTFWKNLFEQYGVRPWESY